MWFLYLHLFMYCITFMDLCMLNHPCISWVKPTCSWCMIFLMCCWILCTGFCWESLHIYSLKILLNNSLFWLHLYLVSEWVYCWLHRISLVLFLPFLFPGKVWGIFVLVLL
jgi:hypothetical protein